MSCLNDLIHGKPSGKFDKSHQRRVQRDPDLIPFFVYVSHHCSVVSGHKDNLSFAQKLEFLLGLKEHF